MKAQELRRLHKKQRQTRKIQKVKNGILFLIFTISVVGFMYLAVDTLDQEIQNNTEYNKNYIQQLEKERAE